MSGVSLETIRQNLETHVARINELLGGSIDLVERDRQNIPIFWVKREKAIEALRTLKEADGLEYHFLADLTGYDDVGGPGATAGQFVVVYQLYSPQWHVRVRVKVRAGLDDTVPTACGLWSAANWAEREVYDLLGVKFSGHPDLRRILLDVRWVGHPLRKEYHWRKQQLFNDAEPMPEHLLKD